MSCQDYTDFIVYSGVSEIVSLHIENSREHQNPPFPVINSKMIRNVIGLAYSFKDKLIFYSDKQSGSINSVHFDGSNHTRLLENVLSVEGLTYDATLDFLFWTSTSDRTLRRIKIGEATLEKSELVVQLGKEDNPRGIDVDTCNGMVYWTNWNRNHPSIQRAYYSGKRVIFRLF